MYWRCYQSIGYEARGVRDCVDVVEVCTEVLMTAKGLEMAAKGPEMTVAVL